MLVLTIRTDKPEAELGLFEDENKLDGVAWQAHRQLAETIHQQIAKLLQSQKKGWDSIQGIVVYKGPGSFTGLRIGASVANALAYGLNTKIAGTTGDDWQLAGISQLVGGLGKAQILPEYGAEAHITQPKH